MVVKEMDARVRSVDLKIGNHAYRAGIKVDLILYPGFHFSLTLKNNWSGIPEAVLHCKSSGDSIG